jgi:hypothetical protein
MRLSLLVIAILALGVSLADTLPAPVDYGKISAIDLVNRTAKGGLHNPYKDSQANIVAQGAALFRSNPCAGCHGGNAGGCMCPPLTTRCLGPDVRAHAPDAFAISHHRSVKEIGLRGAARQVANVGFGPPRSIAVATHD